MTKNKPVHEERLGRIKAAVWANETENGTRYGVTLERLYKKNEKWQSSESFGRDDLLLLARVLDRVHTWLFENEREEK